MNKLMIRHTMDKPLPYDAEVEYLESTGTQYIDTGAIWYGDDYEIQIDFFLTDSTYIGLNVPFGAQDSLTLCALLFQSSPYNGTVLVYGGSGSTDNRAKYDLFNLGRNNITMRLNNNVVTVTINGTVTTYSAQTDCVNVIPTISLFAVHQPDGYKNPARMKLYSFRLIKQGSLIRDMIPVRKGNTGYLYDKVSGRLFGNQGTGSFVVGPDYNPFEHQYLTFIPVEDAVFSWAERATSGHLEYSLNGGQTWVTIADGESTPTITAGNKVMWRGDLKPKYAETNIVTSAGIGTFSATGNYNAYGNTMSLLFYDNYYGSQLDVNDYRVAFGALFYQDTHILTAPLLPATELANYCYANMFRGCSNLVTAVRVLPAITIPSRGCQAMYYGCTNLRVASILLCDSIRSYGCQNMYRNCGNIDYIKCLATHIGTYATSTWVNGVSSTGTFAKAAEMENWSTGADGIPSGWTVVDDPSTITT